MLVQTPMGEGSALATDLQHTPTILQTSSSQPQNTHKPRKSIRKVTKVPQPSEPMEHVADEVVYKELDDSLVRAATTASSFKAEHDNGNIDKTQSKATPNESSSIGTTLGGGPRGNTLRSNEDRMKLNELMELCMNLQTRVLDLEKTKTSQALEITSLKRRVKKLEKKKRSRTHKLKRLYKVGLTARVDSSEDEQSLGEDASKQGRKINDIDDDEDIILVNDQDDAEMFDVNDLHGEELFVEKEVADKEVSAAGKVNAASIVTIVSAAATITTKEVTLAQALVEIKTSKPNLVRSCKLSLMKNKEITREKAQKEQEANIALIKEWDDIQKNIDVNYQLAQRLETEEQEELTIEEKATLFKQHLEKRRKHFAAKAVEEKRNKPPTQAQQRKIMCTYLKNTKGKKLKDLKNNSFDSIQKMFNRVFNRQKVDDDKETTELKELMEIIIDKEEVAIDAIPLAIKSSKIVNWKIHKEGKKSYYKIIRADGKSKMYMMKIQKKSLLSTSQQDLLVQCCHLLVLLVWEQYCLGVIYEAGKCA
nr:hypothetical protein [Tanacetum cinerariifolium]